MNYEFMIRMNRKTLENGYFKDGQIFKFLNRITARYEDGKLILGNIPNSNLFSVNSKGKCRLKGRLINPVNCKINGKDYTIKKEPIYLEPEFNVIEIDNRELWLKIELYSSRDIERLLERLRSERARLMVEVETLAKKAERFYKKAEDLRSKDD